MGASRAEHKLVGVAVIAVGLVLNPFVVARLVFGAWRGGPPAMRAALWTVAGALVVFGVLVAGGKLRIGARLQNVILGTLVTIMTLLLVVIADRVVGKVRGKPAAGLIFPPHSEVGYETPEFRVVVKSNALGFRGEECTAAKGGRYRIVAIGDSFTMGWGLNLDDTWTTLLEQRLNASAPTVEVLNLGQGGADAEADVRNARKAIPVLKPDLVLVCLLQGDDLFQIVERMKRGDAPPVDLSRWERSTAGSIMAFVRGRLFPNLLSTKVKTTVTATWKETAERIQQNLTEEQRRRYETIDPGARAAFLRGELNPIVLQTAILFPDYYVRLDDPTLPDARKGIERTAECLREIADLAAAHGGKTLVVSVPYRAYVSAGDGEALRKLGYSIPASLARSNGAATAIREASVLAGLECWDVTLPVREEARSRALYFGMDGHFNRDGAAYFARMLATVMREHPVFGPATSRPVR